tara:strand:+ start:8991 stop:9785 length:795 start_codon:yes stop_codon:yes gene_type:complete
MSNFSLSKNEIDRIKAQERGLVYIRDALSFYLTEVRNYYDIFNLVIIILSMINAFVETVKTEMQLETAKGPISRTSILFPIALSTIIAFISTYTKFLRFTEKIEETTKSIEKCHNSIDKQRKVLLSASPYLSLTDISNNPVSALIQNNYNDACTTFREAILSAETIWLSRMDPSNKSKYLTYSYKIHKIFEDDLEKIDIIDSILRESFKPENLNSYTISNPFKSKQPTTSPTTTDTSSPTTTDTSSLTTTDTSSPTTSANDNNI